MAGNGEGLICSQLEGLPGPQIFCGLGAMEAEFGEVEMEGVG